MRRNTFLHIRPAFIMAILALCLCAIGTGYAAWSRNLTVNTALSTGSLDIVFDQSRPYSVEVMSIHGVRAGGGFGGDEIDCIIDKGQKRVTLSFDSAMLPEDFADTESVLVFRYPLALGERSTIQSVTPYEADLSMISDEKLESAPDDSKLIIDGNEYVLPKALQDFYAPLYWDVYRQVEVDDGQITGTVFLKLCDESREALRDSEELSLDVAELPEELQPLVTPLEDGTSGLLEAEISVNYSFSVPLFIEQGHL